MEQRERGMNDGDLAAIVSPARDQVLLGDGLQGRDVEGDLAVTDADGTVRAAAARQDDELLAGHPVRRADGRVQPAGRPGILLGLLDHPPLPDSQMLLRAGNSLVLFTDGVTEARSTANRDLYGDDRLREVLATLHDMSADQTADAIQQAVLTFSRREDHRRHGRRGPDRSPVRAGRASRARGRLACRPPAVPGDRPPAPAPRQRPEGGLAHGREDLTGPPNAGLAPERCHVQPAQRTARWRPSGRIRPHARSA